MHASEVTPEVAARANQLYWASDESVNQIADKLDLSKGALYGLIEALQSGLGCPLCGDEVGYPNRTARDREQLECSTCDWDGNPDETTSYVVSGSEADDVKERERILPETAPPPPFIAPRLSTIVTGALVGGAVGLALVMWARRR